MDTQTAHSFYFHKRLFVPLLRVLVVLAFLSFAAATADTCGTRALPLNNARIISKRPFKRDASSLEVSGRQCSTDTQCVQYRGDSLSISKPSASENKDKSRLGDYACIDGACRYVVKAGELCLSANDCAGYHLSRRWMLASPDTLSANSTHELSLLSSSWCASEFCSLESTCGGAWTLPGAPANTPPGADSSKPITNGTVSCCRGLLADAQCAFVAASVDTCGSGYSCTMNNASNKKRNVARDIAFVDPKQLAQASVESSNSSMPIGRCMSQEPHQQVWIGVLLVLVGGATLNIGLNLQKYAFRKQQESAEQHAMQSTESAAIARGEKHGKMHSAAKSECTPDLLFYSTDVLDLQSNRKISQSARLETNANSIVFPISAADSSHRSRAPDIITEAHTQSSSSGSENRLIGTANMSRLSLSSANAYAVNSHATAPADAEQKRGAWFRRLSKVQFKERLQSTPFGSPYWAIGLIIFVLGNVINFIALQFAPQSLVAPLGAVALVTNVIVAPILNNEKIGMFDIGGIALIIAGCVIVVVFSGIVQQNYRLCILIQLLKAKPTVIYLCLIFAAILIMYIFLWVVERAVERYCMENQLLADNNEENAVDAIGQTDTPNIREQHVVAAPSAGVLPQPWESEDIWTAVSAENKEANSQTQYNSVAAACDIDAREFVHISSRSSSSDTQRNIEIQNKQVQLGRPALATDKWTYKRPWLRIQNPLMLFDKWIRPIPPSSRLVRYGLPLAYASLGSLMATLTTLFAKSLVNLLSATIFDHENQFTSFIPWCILLVTAFTAASQVYWINQGLLRYDALLQVPVFYVVWTVFDIIGGGIYFNEFKLFTTVKYVLFTLGVVVIFSGVGLLSNRLKHA
ncbi:magnesium transporter NIPA-domain-containing protein [Coemansia spiralis]|nr:magnesium transporter NIPA-domain-containing protein [Coemansia spiralis]